MDVLATAKVEGQLGKIQRHEESKQRKEEQLAELGKFSFIRRIENVDQLLKR
jgi:hypothetical protein